MKYVKKAAMLLILSVVLSTNVMAADSRYIQVTGSSSVEIKAKISSITFYFSAYELSSEKVSQELKIIEQQISNNLRYLGISDGYIQISEPVISRSIYDTEESPYYYGFEDLTITFTDGLSTEKVLKAAEEGGCNEGGIVELYVSDYEERSIAVLEKAVANAFIKAQRMAGAVGASIKSPLYLIEKENRSPFDYYGYYESINEEGSYTYSFDEFWELSYFTDFDIIELSASVEAAFEI